ncbi:octopamine receptor Oamb-like [Copidosoma floridanum]|uniref:octopamine receptor Oamb-like n=1 Tax=Copidosoma floridanum TaxID=29053 RepID=UPI0006C9BFBD|nr:octopamine receptor Oamb-like [Copidosoma floridanum]
MDDQTDTFLNTTELLKWLAFGVLLLSIVMGNTMIIIVQCLSRRRFGNIPNQLIFNLAVADLFNGLLLLCSMIRPRDLSHFSSSARKIWCIVPQVLAHVGCTASFYIIGAIAVDRYFLIIHPIIHRKYVTKWSISATIAVIWCITALISTGPIFWINTDMQSNCSNYKVEVRYYDKCVLLPNVMIVWLVLLIAYWRIWRATRAYTNELRTRSKEVGQISKISKRKSNTAVLTILGCFSICWLPYMVLELLAAFGSYETNNKLYFIVSAIALCNSGINPVIYAWRNPAFQEAYRRLFRRKAPNNNCNVSSENNVNKNSESKNDDSHYIDAITLGTISAEVNLNVTGQGS